MLLTKSGKLAATPPRQLEKNRTVSWFGLRKDGRSSFRVQADDAALGAHGKTF